MARWLPLLLCSCFYVSAEDRAARFDLDGDGVARPADCDDDDKAVGERSWFADTDGDGFGDPGARVKACEAPADHVADDTDCDDGDPARFPGAAERCDGVDDDCDGTADNGAEVPTWYQDTDGDGQGDPAAVVMACDQPAGAVANADDCDDTRDAVKLGGVEVACNDLDDDCDGDTDLDDDDVDLLDWTWYFDGDGDLYGRDDAVEVSCTPSTDYVTDGGDCADDDPTIHPGAIEACNGWDDNCDDLIDPYGAAGATLYYWDLDGDGRGDPTNTVLACAQPYDTQLVPGDCDDADACAYTGATEVCNGQDDDCDLIPDDGVCTPIDTADPVGAPCF